MKPVFFASYARADNRSAYLQRAITALRDRVREKLGVDEEDLEKIAFFDTTSITTGQQWEDALAEGLKKSRVLVCLCSPTYLNSPYCAKEFHVFRARLRDAGASMKGRTVIIPVIWEWGSPKMTLPKAISAFNYKHGAFPKKYQEDGLAPLARLQTQADQFDEAIEVLANLIGEAHAASKLKDWDAKLVFSALPTYFDAPGAEPAPYNVVMTVLHKDHLQWRPFVAGPNIGGRIDGVMQAQNLAWREIVPSPETFLESLREAEQQRQVTIVVADAVSIGKPQFRALLDVVDDAGLGNCVVLYAWDHDEWGAAAPADIRAHLQAALPKSGRSTLHEFFPSDDSEAFDAALSRAVTVARKLLIEKDRPQKVDSADLRAAAIREGITPDARPALTGPAGENQ